MDGPAARRLTPPVPENLEIPVQFGEITGWISQPRNLLPLLSPAAALILGLWVRKALFRRLRRLSQRTRSTWDDVVIESIRTPFLLWCIMGGIYVALTLYALPDRLLAISGKVLFILAVLSLVMAFSNASASLIRASAGRITGPLPMASLTHHAIRIVLWILGALIVLNTLGISVTPILATLGVGGLAVALALQDTLANLFAGFHVIASGQVRSGDFVRLESGQEGTIEDIGWRITKIRMLSNNIVLIPNAKLAQAVLVNYHLPEPEMSVLIEVSVHYDSDLALVEKVTVDVASEVLHTVAGGVSGFTPFIRYHTFGDSGIHFTVILRVKEYVDQYLIKHEFVKSLHERYRREGIVIPYPMRTLTWEPVGGRPAQPAGPVG